MNAIDSKSKYILAHLFVDKRAKKKCYEFLKQIKDGCYEQILEVFKKDKHRKFKDKELIEYDIVTLTSDLYIRDVLSS